MANGDVMLKVDGKTYRHTCGANVFRHAQPEEMDEHQRRCVDGRKAYWCNGCNELLWDESYPEMSEPLTAPGVDFVF